MKFKLKESGTLHNVINVNAYEVERAIDPEVFIGEASKRLNHAHMEVIKGTVDKVCHNCSYLKTDMAQDMDMYTNEHLLHIQSKCVLNGDCPFELKEESLRGRNVDFVTMDEYESLPPAIKSALPKRKHKPKPALTEEELHLIKDIEIPDGVNSGTW